MYNVVCSTLYYYFT